MAAISIQLTPQGIRSIVVEQELVFFIGPSPTNRLNDIKDYMRRVEDVEPYLDEADDRRADLVSAVSRAYGVPVRTLATSLRQGGKRDVSCPNLCLDLVESDTEDGTPLFHISDPHNGAALCRGLITLFDADWVDLWWMGSLGNAQVTCERDGRALWLKGQGRTEEV